MSDHDYDVDRLNAAIKDAQLEDFLKEQPEGLKTELYHLILFQKEKGNESALREYFIVTQRFCCWTRLHLG